MITSPALLVRAPFLRRITLPLAQRTGHDIVGGRVVVAWLPPTQLGALADAVERHGTAANTAKVAHFLRNVANSRVKPHATLDFPF